MHVQVVCTGKEERLLDCDFPQDFGGDYNFYYSSYDYSFAPGPAPEAVAVAPSPSNGLPGGGCDSGDRNRLSVVCRRFEITGAHSATPVHMQPQPSSFQPRVYVLDV